eukprot:1180570-Prorocentrum_minimum.AAC.4
MKGLMTAGAGAGAGHRGGLWEDRGRCSDRLRRCLWRQPPLQICHPFGTREAAGAQVAGAQHTLTLPGLSAWGNMYSTFHTRLKGRLHQPQSSVPDAHGKQFPITTLSSATKLGRPTLALSCSNFDTNLGLWYADTGKVVEMVNTNQVSDIKGYYADVKGYSADGKGYPV